METEIGDLYILICVTFIYVCTHQSYGTQWKIILWVENEAAYKL